jgi:uncharacterized cupredoxin-like copper-binding protein
MGRYEMHTRPRGPAPATAHLFVYLTAAVVLLTAVACGDGGGGDIGVTLREWEVAPEETSVDAGEVTFDIENVGDETHEFVVVRTDLDPAELPTAEDGSVDEEGEGIEPVDEVEDIPSGESGELTVDLDEGSYVLFCNIVEEEEGGEVESHYQNGMRTAFTVG